MRQPVAGDGGAIAVLGEVGLDAALPVNILVEDIVNDVTNVGEDIPVLYIGLIIACGVGDVEIIPHAAVPLGIVAVESIRNLRIDIGADGVFRPGRIDFAGCHVFNIVGERNRDILGIGARRPQMDGQKLRNIRLSVQSGRSLLKILGSGLKEYQILGGQFKFRNGDHLNGLHRRVAAVDRAFTLSTRKYPGAAA